MICSSRAYQREVTQIMHKDLAQHVVSEYLLFDNGEPQLEQAKHTFHDLMILGPNFEFYLLDTQGKIVAFSADPALIKRQRIALAPIAQFIHQSQTGVNHTNRSLGQSSVLYADDPRSEHGEKIFSAAPILQNNELQGYMLVILGSQIQDHIAAGLWSSRITLWGLWVFALGLLFSLLATLGLLHWLTRPLRRLTSQIQQVQSQGFTRELTEQRSISDEFAPWQGGPKDEIHVLAQAFEQALQTLQEQYHTIVSIDELRKELLSHISHDLRSPLASLLGYLETWELNHQRVDAKESGEYIAIAKRNAQKISTLIEQLFELAHLDSGNVQVNRESLPIAELVEDVLQKYRISADEQHIHLHVSPQDSSIKVFGDIEKLERVFSNLVENALRHTKPGGTITIKLNDQGQRVQVEVADTGIGIPQQDLPFIFDAHYKAGNSVRGNTAHGGLGLAITKKLLDLHSSTIHVRSEINAGTCFAFALPTHA